MKNTEREAGFREKETEFVEKGREETASIIGAKQFKLKAKIPWNTLSSVIQGVIKPLIDNGYPIEVWIEIKAKAEKEFDRNVLETKVKEILNQIGAEIEVFEEEKNPI